MGLMDEQESVRGRHEESIPGRGESGPELRGTEKACVPQGETR